MSHTVLHGRPTQEGRVPFLFNSPPCPPGSYCEAFSGPSLPRQHWHAILSTLQEKGEDVLTAQYERATRMRHEDGATINPFDDLEDRATSWALDMIPLPISEDEWMGIETGVLQRAHLLEKILADTYGHQELLKDGSIPAELIFANPNFLHACHNIQPAEGRYLTYYAVDMYRDVDGRFKVLRDYGGNPAGIGYALENRIVMSRVFSDLYHRTQLRRLAPFFQTFHRSLIQRASLRKDDPGIVLFSPGPESELYFEHALLSRYLGYPLVEGQDLTVRNGKIFLKKLAGLEPVEAVFRHIADLDSDPFALRRATANGVAGLLQVCREQNIVMANPVGSGFIDTPALKVYLSKICQKLLGENLLLENHPTWWCGNRNDLDYTLKNLDQLTLSSALDLSHVPDASVDFKSQILATPMQYIASAPLYPAASPAWTEKGLSSSYNILRVFACATEDGFTVMPGGLAITAADIGTLTANSPRRQQSKDIWVLSDKPVESFSLMKGLNDVPEFKRSSDLPSRVADNLLWLGRYLERAESLIRLLRSVYRRLTGENRPEDVPELQFILTLLGTKHIIPQITETENQLPLIQDLFQQLHDGLYRKDRQESVVSILKLVQESAKNVRDRLSVDSSRVINRLENFADNPSSDPLELLDNTLFILSSFSGLAMESMTRGLGWRFMDMGRRVERAMNQVKLINIGLHKMCGDSQNTLEALLEISDSIMTYRGRYRSAFQVAPVLDLLLADETNPKSVAFQLCQLAEHVEYLPQQQEIRFSCKEEWITLKMLTSIRLLDLSATSCIGGKVDNKELEEFLHSVEILLEEFAQQVSGHYLSRVPATPHYAVISGERA